MNITSKTWKWTAKTYRDFYNLTLEQARGLQGKYFKSSRWSRAWKAKAKQLRADNERLRGLIEQVEFVNDDHDDPIFCPWCHMLGTREHQPTCPAFDESGEVK